MKLTRTRFNPVLAAACSVVALGAAMSAAADQPSERGTAPEMKVKIDKQTGKMRNATAAEELAMAPSATEKQLAIDWWNATVPGDASDGIITLSDGTQMKRMDVESLQAFAITLDDDGNLVGLHTTADGEIETPVTETAAEEDARETF